MAAAAILKKSKTTISRPQLKRLLFFEITNKEKKNYNGCNGLAGSERVLK